MRDMALIIRPSVSSDRDELARLRTALWPDSQEAEIEDLVRLAPSDGMLLVAAREEGGLAGFAEIALRELADGCRTSPVAYLEGIWVDPDVRRGGAASALVREAERWARTRGLSEFASDCDVQNRASQWFHSAAGFEEVQRNVCFRRDLTPERTRR